jgi:hypothetical protein
MRNKMPPRSVNFFMDEKDEESFSNLVLSRQNTYFVRYTMYSEPAPECYSSVDEYLAKPVKDEFYKLPSWLIWCKDLGNTELKYIRSGCGNQFYLYDHAENQIISLDRSVAGNGVISVGEMSFQTEAHDWEFNYCQRNVELVKFHSKLARWIRKNGVKASYDGVKVYFNTYILPGALDFFYNGGKLGPWTYNSAGFKDESFRPLGYPVDEKDTLEWRWAQRP